MTSTPASMKIQPTVCTATPGTTMVSAKVRIAPITSKAMPRRTVMVVPPSDEPCEDGDCRSREIPPPGLAPTSPASTEGGSVDPCPARHCWVSRPVDGGPPRPGLLLEWRRMPGDDWEGRVVYSVELRRGSWATVEEWLPAGGLAN